MATEIDGIREFCNLPEDELKARRERASRELFAFVREREERPAGLILTFDETPGMRSKLDAFVAAERVCCSGIEWSVVEEAGSLRLGIDGIDPKSAAFASIGTSVVSAEESVGPGFWPRLLRAAGLGSLGAAIVCSALPLGAAAVFGATPLSLLDTPWVIAGSALALGAALWLWEGRRNRARAGNAVASGCGC